jgi:hypothetical protein
MLCGLPSFAARLNIFTLRAFDISSGFSTDPAFLATEWAISILKIKGSFSAFQLGNPGLALS